MSVHRVGDQPGEMGRRASAYLPDPRPETLASEGALSCSARVRGVASDLFAMLQAEFRLREAIDWVVQRVTSLTGKGAELVNRALGRDFEPSPLGGDPVPPNPTIRAIPHHKVDDPEALRVYQGLFEGLLGPWIQGGRDALGADDREFVRLVSKLAALKVCETRDNPPKVPGESVAAQIANRHPDLIPNAFLYLEAIGGPAKAAEVVKRVGDRLLDGVTMERVKQARKAAFCESAVCLEELLRAVWDRDGGSPGAHEKEILRTLKRVSPAILLGGDPRARREHEMVYIRSRYLEVLQRALTSVDPAEQFLFRFLAPVLAETLAEVSVQGLDFGLEPMQIDAYFFQIGEALAPKVFHVEGAPVRDKVKLPSKFDPRLQDREREALLQVTQTWLEVACERGKTGQLVGLLGTPFLNEVDRGLTLVLTPDGYFNPRQLLPVLKEQVGEASVPFSDLRERQARIVGERFLRAKDLNGDIGIIGKVTNVGSGLVWTRQTMRMYPLLWRSAALRAWDAALAKLFPAN